jgi:hypothetical protein
MPTTIGEVRRRAARSALSFTVRDQRYGTAPGTEVSRIDQFASMMCKGIILPAAHCEMNRGPCRQSKAGMIRNVGNLFADETASQK